MPLDPRRSERPPPSIMAVIVLLNGGVVVSLAQMITAPLVPANIIIAVLVTAGLFVLARGVRWTHRAAWWATALAGGFGILVAMSSIGTIIGVITLLYSVALMALLLIPSASRRWFNGHRRTADDL